MNHLIKTDQLLIALCVVIAVSFFSFLVLLLKKNMKDTPQDILQKKLSIGEIDHNEYEQIKRQLQRDEDLKVKMFFLSRM